MKTIEDLEVRLELLQKDLAELKKDKSINKRFRADKDNIYYYIQDYTTLSTPDWYNAIDYFRYDSMNYFETREQAQLAIDRQIIKNKIMNIAEELNGDNVIDWDNNNQAKYSIAYSHQICSTVIITSYGYYRNNEIYCLDSKFEEVILERLTKKEIYLYYKRQS